MRSGKGFAQLVGPGEKFASRDLRKGWGTPVFERFTERARRVIILAREEAGRFRHDFVGTEHVLLGLIRDGEGIATAVLQRLGLRLETVKAEVERALAGFPKTLTFGEVPFTPQAKRVLELSIEEARQLGHNYIGTEHLLLGLMKEGQSIAAKILESLGARLDEVRQETLALLGDQYYPRPKKRSQTPVLDEFARDLTQLARETKLDPVIGREQEIERVIQILARRTKNNPVLIGEPGVGKTAIVEGPAQKIIRHLRHKYEAHHRVKITERAISAAVQLADRYITDRQLPDKAIDVIDEASSRTRLMALTPPPELKEIEKELERVIREKDMYLEAQEFEKAASLREKEKVLRHRDEELKREWEKNKGKGTQSVEEEDIEFIVSRWTGIPLAKLEEKESEKLARMEEALHGRIIGQNDAVAAVARAIRRSRAGLKDAKRPVGSFVFLGPTGVGKTELARALAEYLFGDENALIRVDMSEYMEKFSVSRLLGAPPGYVGYEEGGFLTEKVRRRPYSVVLFDEIEKAHPDVFNMMLQVLDDGRLTDSLGHVVDFKNTILIMTSNLGTSLIGKRVSPGFLQESDESSYDKMKERVLEELKRAFRPEFINRVDDIIVFHALSKENITAIVRLMLTRINAQISDKGIQLEPTEAALDLLVQKGFDPTYGARQLRRTIQKEVEDPLAEAIVRGQFADGARIEVDVNGEGFIFREIQIAEPRLALAEH